VFSRAVGEFLREEVRNGTFKGNYMLNLKEQLRMRCLRMSGGDKDITNVQKYRCDKCPHFAEKPAGHGKHVAKIL
jgi:hypothetical protein